MSSGKGFDVKTCKECRAVKPLADFPYKDSKHVSRRTICKVCATLRKQTDEYKSRQSVNTKRMRRNDPERRAKQIETTRAYGNTPRGRATRLYLAAQYRAKIGGLEFSICKAHIEVVLMLGVCERTGIPFDFTSPENGKNFNPYAPSIDKRNPFEGYTAANIQVVCNAYNLAKNQFTDAQFIEFCKIVVNKNVK